MRPETKVHFLFESVGRPDNTFTGEDTVKGIVLRLASWLTAVPMGHKIRVTLARNSSELRDRRSAANSELFQELESIMQAQECEHDWQYNRTDYHGSHKGEDAEKCSKCGETRYAE